MFVINIFDVLFSGNIKWKVRGVKVAHEMDGNCAFKRTQHAMSHVNFFSGIVERNFMFASH